MVSWVGEAQENVQSKAVYTGNSFLWEYVSHDPLDSTIYSCYRFQGRGKDKAFHCQSNCTWTRPAAEDDFFVLNRSELEQSITLAPASLVFNAYSSSSQPTDPSLAVGPNHVFIVYNMGFTIIMTNQETNF